MVRWSFSKILVVRCWFATSLVVPPFSNYGKYRDNKVEEKL